MWIKEQELKKGDEIVVTQSEGTLLLSKEREHTGLAVTLTVDNPLLARAGILNGYRKGYAKIVLTLAHEKQIALVDEICHHNLLGFELTKKNGKQCTLEAFSEPQADQYELILSKFFATVKDMLAVYTESLEQKKPLDHDALHTLEERALKYMNFCRRLANQRSGSTASFTILFLHELSRAQRELYHALSLLRTHKEALSCKLLLSSLGGLMLTLEQAYASRTLSMLSSFSEHHQAYAEEGERKLIKGGKEALIFHRLLLSGRHCYHAISPLVGVIL
jgi:hypothetical protein